jgi:hypothetical protein
MDPYLEGQAFWRDFHSRFINSWCELLADQLPPNYEARIDEQVRLIELQPEEMTRVLPDVGITWRGSSPAPAPAAAGTLTLEPVLIPLPETEEIRETHIELLSRPDRTLVAVLELLSPTNKQDAGRGDYLAKRRAILRQPIHLVELDLLLGGRRLPAGKPLPPGDFYAVVTRWDRRPNSQVYAWTAREPLPVIPIPPSAPDPDVRLDLGKVFAIAYERGRYARSVDYRVPPAVPLDPDDLAWCAEQAKAARP